MLCTVYTTVRVFQAISFTSNYCHDEIVHELPKTIDFKVFLLEYTMQMLIENVVLLANKALERTTDTLTEREFKCAKYTIIALFK